MIEYFTDIRNHIKAHAEDEFPKESCGIVVDNEYHPCKNTATTPETDFKIHHNTYMKYERMGEVQAIVHSHNNFAMASYNDMVHQMSSGVPWGIVNVVGGKTREILFWGDQLPTQDFYERPFHSGIYDCFSLVRDVYRVEYSFELPNIPREHDFWSDPRGKAHFEEQMGWMVPEHLTIENKNTLLPGDGLLFKLSGSKVWNHCGIYIGNGLMAHHLERKLSRREPIFNWRKKIDTLVRPGIKRKIDE